MTKAAALAQAVEREPVACGEWLIPIKLCYGVGQIAPQASAEQVLIEADSAMYARKPVSA